MNLRETFRVALRAIRRNKVRSALTMLGVIIGVASVIAMIALGSGARASIDEQIQSQGTTLIYLSSGSWGGPGRARQGAGTTQTLTIEAGLNGLRSRQDVGRRIAALVARLIPPDDPALARHRLVRPGRRVAGRSFLSA